jgi:hypothetical protein
MIDLSLDHKIVINNEFDAAIQELDLLFNTETTELINNPTFGTNFEQFLWQLTPAVSELKRYINERINETFFLSQMNYDVDVNVYKGELRMIYDVTIYVEDENGNKINRKYQLR